MEPLAPDVVLDLARRAHWPGLHTVVSNAEDKGKDAKRQNPLCGIECNLDIVKKVIRRIGRAHQFGLDSADEDAGSGSDCENHDASE